jgi:hypothetical protein
MKYKTKIMVKSIVDVISTITSKTGWKTIGYTYNGNDSIAEWLDNASGDFDNLITPWGEELLSEEEFEYAENLQTNSLSIYRDWSLKPDFIN